MQTISNFSAHITSNGNILFNHNAQWFFAKPSGKVLREASQGEVDYLLPNCAEILFKAEIPSPVVEKWKFIFSVDETDDSNYYWAHSNNGGKYSNTDRHNYFVRNNGGEIEFLCLTESFSSGEFSQTWDGRYQNDLCNIYLIDVEGGLTLREQGREDSDASIQQFGVVCDWKNLFQPVRYTSSNYEQENGCYTGESVTTEKAVTLAEYISIWRKICAVTGVTPRQIAGPKRRKRANTRR